MKFTKKSIYIGLFSVLYLIVAFSSFWHACAFFGLANNSWMSIILAFAFEIGQAAVLFSLLTSKKDRSRVMPWVLMTMFTLVQVIGNVFSSYKYIISNSVENLRFFKEPIFIWTTLPDDQATVIVTYVVGAILPIAALLLTSMITNYLSDQEEEKLKELENKESIEKKEVENEQREEKSDNDNEQQPIGTIENSEGTKNKDTEDSKEENPLINQNSILEMENQGLQESLSNKDKELEQLKEKLNQTEEDHDKIVDEKFEAERKFDDLLHDYSEQNKEFYRLKQELEELKKSKENDNKGEISETNLEETSQDGIERIEESENPKQEETKTPIEEDKKKIENILEKEQIEKLNIPKENFEQVEDLIKNGVKQNNLKESHFIN